MGIGMRRNVSINPKSKTLEVGEGDMVPERGSPVIKRAVIRGG